MSHDVVSGTCDRLKPTLSRGLVLTIRSALPGINTVGTKDIKYLIADVKFGTVAEKFVHGAFVTDFICKGIDELCRWCGGPFVTLSAGVRINGRVKATRIPVLIRGKDNMG